MSRKAPGRGGGKEESPQENVEMGMSRNGTAREPQPGAWREGLKKVKSARRPGYGEVGGGPFSATFSQEHRYTGVSPLRCSSTRFGNEFRRNCDRE
jgi:hypothetical protein